MLDQLDAPEQLTLLAHCRDELDLSQAQPLLSQSGFAPSREADRRRYPRKRTNQRAPMQITAALPAMARTSEWHAVRIIDISRGGLGLLHSAQLYPKEGIRIVNQEGIVQRAEVVWCQRVSERCYHVGCSFVGSERLG